MKPRNTDADIQVSAVKEDNSLSPLSPPPHRRLITSDKEQWLFVHLLQLVWISRDTFLNVLTPIILTFISHTAH